MQPDQRALLQLVLERGQSYDEIASVLGTDREDVRARARAALTELAGSDPDAEVNLTDYLLGQADPIVRAATARHLQEEPRSLQLASALVDHLRLIAPSAQLPQVHLPPGNDAAGRAGPAGLEGRVQSTLSHSQRWVALTLAVAGLFGLAVILLVAGVFDGEEQSAPLLTSPGEQDVVSVDLRPPDAGNSSGTALLGLATMDQPFVELDVDRLPPLRPDQAYVLWLLLTPSQGYPISPFAVDASGSYSDRFPVPAFAISIAARAQFIDVARVDRSALKAEVDQLRRSLGREGEDQIPLLEYQGVSALRGDLPSTGGPALLENGHGAGGNGGG